MTFFSKWTGSVFSLLSSSAADIANDTDLQLVDLAKMGNREAFQQLLELHYEMIYNVAYRFMGHSEDAEDITQDVCLALADKIQSFRGNARFQTWLYSVIMNACRDAHRKQNKQQAKLLDYSELDLQLRSMNIEHRRQITWLYRQISLLNEPLRMTAFLVLAEDLTHADAGKVLACSESTVSWRMYQVRKLLKQLSDGGYDD